MTTARGIMHAGATRVGEHETMTAAARPMHDLGVSALPIYGDDDRLYGMMTDRHTLIKCVVAECNPGTTRAGELTQGSAYHVDAIASIEESSPSRRNIRFAACRNRQPPVGGHSQRGGYRAPSS